MSVDGNDEPNGGVITEMHFTAADGFSLASFSDFSWDIVTFFDALNAAGTGHEEALEALFSADPISIDATSATSGYDMYAGYLEVSVDTFTEGSAFADFLVGGSQNDKVYGLGGDDTISGQNGKDKLFGGAGVDQLYGDNGKDSLFGGKGNDYLYGGKGADLLNGGAGASDTAVYDYYAASIAVNLSTEMATDGWGFADTLISIENVWGSGFSDTITGSSDNNVLCGFDGNDTLKGLGGKDTLVGGNQMDTLDGGLGSDTLKGGGGADILIGGKGKDKLFGGNGADTFLFKSANHSTNNNKADVIKDFAIGTDLIDLFGVASGLVFIGTDGFSGIANEVRATVNGGGDTLVRVDVDGDFLADMKIVLEGVVGITAGDFMF